MDQTIPAGATLARYRIVERIGAGGMGEVYKAFDTSLERIVALKILPPELVSHQDRLQRFVLEAKAASGLSHPNIVTIHEIGSAPIDGQDGELFHYIAMELVEGGTLRAFDSPRTTTPCSSARLSCPGCRRSAARVYRGRRTAQ